MSPDAPSDPSPPRLSIPRLFARFLSFGLHAWGGPAAQIAMLQRELVDRERWTTPDRFNRALAVYQLLPGPEATELCCYFGYLSRGRLGAIAAGLGFITPGLLLMLALSWLYVNFGVGGGGGVKAGAPATGALVIIAGAFACMKPAVAALVVRAAHRIGSHAVARDPWKWAIAIVSLGATLAGAHWAIVLAGSALASEACAPRANKRWRWLAALTLALVAGAGAWKAIETSRAATAGTTQTGLRETGPSETRDESNAADLSAVQQRDDTAFTRERVSTPRLLGSGLKAGMLTFGGAYTVVPFLRDDAAARHHWVSPREFFDGLALSGVLPAPLVIFGTFVGFVAGSWAGALAMTLGIFAPAFAFTVLGHSFFERVVNFPAAHRALDGVTAGVVGVIAAAAVTMTLDAVSSALTGAVFVASLAALFSSRSRWITPLVILGAGVIGAVATKL
ncbi:MAG: chromate transporter [Phycisphaerales bacterium]|jgi:chromate transporter|nr:chromate transporter [Phycisphaerales bacterium]